MLKQNKLCRIPYEDHGHEATQSVMILAVAAAVMLGVLRLAGFTFDQTEIQVTDLLGYRQQDSAGRNTGDGYASPAISADGSVAASRVSNDAAAISDHEGVGSEPAAVSASDTLAQSDMAAGDDTLAPRPGNDVRGWQTEQAEIDPVQRPGERRRRGRVDPNDPQEDDASETDSQDEHDGGNDTEGGPFEQDSDPRRAPTPKLAAAGNEPNEKEEASEPQPQQNSGLPFPATSGGSASSGGAAPGPSNFGAGNASGLPFNGGAPGFGGVGGYGGSPGNGYPEYGDQRFDDNARFARGNTFLPGGAVTDRSTGTADEATMQELMREMMRKQMAPVDGDPSELKITSEEDLQTVPEVTNATIGNEGVMPTEWRAIYERIYGDPIQPIDRDRDRQQPEAPDEPETRKEPVVRSAPSEPCRRDQLRVREYLDEQHQLVVEVGMEFLQIHLLHYDQRVAFNAPPAGKTIAIPLPPTMAFPGAEIEVIGVTDSRQLGTSFRIPVTSTTDLLPWVGLDSPVDTEL